MNKKVVFTSLVAILFVVVAVAGAAIISHGINRTAEVTGSSAGRADDPKPNTSQQMEYSKKSETPSTRGSMTTNNVPPASK